MSDARLIRPGLPLPLDAVELTYARSGGPGGQNVNKVETKVTARLRLTDIPGLPPHDLEWLRTRLASRLIADDTLSITSSKTRHRDRNVDDALDRMTDVLSKALERPKKRRPTRPTRGSRERRLESKKRRGETKRMRRPPGE